MSSVRKWMELKSGQLRITATSGMLTSCWNSCDYFWMEEDIGLISFALYHNRKQWSVEHPWTCTRPYRQRNPDLPSWIEDLEDTLECPVCLRIFLDPPVYYCENQHPLCSKCHQPLFKESKPCPICRGQVCSCGTCFLPPSPLPNFWEFFLKISACCREV